ncbi:hypothetical protein Q73A0000_01395 [Kaistella flava (ex Peng et al. 2021)]|uniref:DUF4288 domain-containing protein n=1 Tax=Kaistella flava (ex Peng et al. 2021) TaxID=2038776 RepID=A0A7M2Y4E2_9FLAO|nr:hypothetical protein [Kaistella flava (ex Peng et al. 2021)]QOW09097.1 hypothetical protein Q73A0000_01395 [Kaistella flava (ex Peng et al. 2021)]
MMTKYYYEVDIFTTTFEKDENETKPFRHIEKFEDENLSKAREEAEEYYNEKVVGIDTSTYIFPFASPEDFNMGENSAISIDFSLVECYDGQEIRHSLIEPDEAEETTAIENYLFSE